MARFVWILRALNTFTGKGERSVSPDAIERALTHQDPDPVRRACVREHFLAPSARPWVLT